MRDLNSEIEITLRLPGRWKHPGELFERIPDGFQLQEHSMSLPDGSSVDLYVMEPDDQFAGIFRSSCRRPPADSEWESVQNYTAKIGLSCKFDARDLENSLSGARKMLQAGAAICRAGAAGVFIDNSGLAHGAESWLEMHDNDTPDAISYAFVGVIRGKTEFWTMGMHTLGQTDIRMKIEDVDEEGTEIIETIGYLCAGDKPIGDGHILCDTDGPRFTAESCDSGKFESGNPMFNPYGELRLVSIADIADRN